MKRILLAFAILFGVVSGPVVEASAASVTLSENGITVRDGRGDGYRHHHRHHRDYYQHHRHSDYRHYKHRRHHYRERCRVRVVKTYRHHRVIFREVRVCR